MIYDAVDALVEYAVSAGLIPAEETVYSRNLLLDLLGETDYVPGARREASQTLPEILYELTDAAVALGLLADTTESRDIFDTKLMNCVTPRPAELRRVFWEKYALSPQAATDWYYSFCRANNYIRADRVARDRRWTYAGKYGLLDITINRSKPEKDPRDIAAAGAAKTHAYPKCQLCAENEGYAGRIGHPARANHRIIPLTLGGEDWALQYSPYVYYNEHCIVLRKEHVPMAVTRQTFVRLVDFVRQFPHYFMGSNAGLPVVGGSILSHDHFQGGRYVFAMERAPLEQEIPLPGFPDVDCGRVRWPLSVLRLRADDPERLIDAAYAVLTHWQGYTDEAARILARTDAPHNAVTPIARRRGEAYELDLALRNNLTTPERPYGLYHPREALHHIKKENIGLIEVMGLAVLPARLDAELEAVAEAILSGGDLYADERTAKHADWALSFLPDCAGMDRGALREKLKLEVGRVFEQVLEDCAVFPRTVAGEAAWAEYIDSLTDALQ